MFEPPPPCFPFTPASSQSPLKTIRLKATNSPVDGNMIKSSWLGHVDHGPIAAAPGTIANPCASCRGEARIPFSKRHFGFAHRKRRVDRHLMLWATPTKNIGASTDFFNRCTWYLIPSG
jgi:hypothetical protein